jgi:hypothetical protein
VKLSDAQAALLSLASRRGVATAHDVSRDMGEGVLVRAYAALWQLEKDGLVSHSGLSAECNAVNRAFKKYPLDVAVPRARGVAFCLTEAGIQRTRGLLKTGAANG